MDSLQDYYVLNINYYVLQQDLIKSQAQIREFKNLGRRRRGERQSKNDFIFTYKCCGTLKSLTLFITIKTFTKLNLGHSDKFKIKI